MEVVGELIVARYARKHANAKTWLEKWLAISKVAMWRTIQDVQKAFPAADGGVKVKSGEMVTVFDVGGNHHLLIAFINYRVQRMTVLELLPHSEYSKNFWKKRW